MPRAVSLRPLLLAAALGVAAAGCAPSLSPLYRDFERVGPPPEASREAVLPPSAARAEQTVLADALQDAGWQLAPGPGPAVATAPRVLSRWGLYDVYVAVELVPTGGPYVRAFFHPFRRFVTGGRSKIPYLPGRAERRLLRPLADALEARGYQLLGTPQERDARLVR